MHFYIKATEKGAAILNNSLFLSDCSVVLTHPKEALSHILQGAAARYACCDDGVDTAVSQTQPDQIDWERFERMVSHIIIGTDNAITVHF